jgi:mannosyltransferase
MRISGIINDNKIVLTSLLLFLLNFGIKIFGITYYDIAMDEPFSIFYAQMDLSSIMKMLANENNPALHFILLHFWIKLFGISAFSVRFLSVLFSSMTVVVIYLMGRKFFSFQTGLFAALIYTVSRFHIYFSHEARVYPLFIFLTAVSLFYFLQICKEPKKRSAYISLMLANILLIYSHYFGLFVIATEFVIVLFIANFRNIYKKLSLVFLLVAVSYIPNIIIFFHRFTVSVQMGTWVRKPEITELYGNLNRFLNSKYVMIVLLVCILVNLIFLLWKKQFMGRFVAFLKDTSSRVVVLWFVFPYLSMFVLSYWAPMFLDRYIIYTSIAFFLLVAMFLSKFTDNSVLKMVSYFAIMITMMWDLTLAPDNNRRVKQVVETVKDMKEKDADMLMIISPEYSYLEFSYHYNINYFKDYKNTLSLLNRDNIYPLRDLTNFDSSKLHNCKVVYLDCGTEFAFGKNPILTELKANRKEDSTIYVFEIYTLHCFEADTVQMN